MHSIRLIGICVLLIASQSAVARQPVLQFDNGRWFDGSGFEDRTMYTREGRLSLHRPETVDEVIDLDGAHVIPPLCEAHNHNLGGDEPEDAIIDRYLRAGIYYVGILSNLPLYTGVARRNFNRPDSVDLQFANGGITAPMAHPIPLRERLLGYGAYPGFTRETLADHAYFTVASEDDLDRIWPIALSYRPDFIKIFIMHSEDQAMPPATTVYDGQTGVHPELVNAIVERSHAHGLRVFAHIATAQDFRVATAAGVDVIAHLPGRQTPSLISREDARRAAQREISVITTASLATRFEDEDPDRYAAVREGHAENLRRLREAGVAIAIGSDQYDADSRVETEFLRELGLFSPAELLTMWTRNCARTIFPDREVGQLGEGFESSFLALDSNPLIDWSALERIRLRVKDGRVLELPQTDEAETPTD
jgi:imidazolonepropionase-like amidohydrolase